MVSKLPRMSISGACFLQSEANVLPSNCSRNTLWVSVTMMAS